MGKVQLGVVRLFKPVLFFTLATLATGCVKKRPDIASQGANLQDLIAVSEVKTWKHTLTTTDQPAQMSTVTDAENLQVDKDVSNINVLGVVKWNSDSPLLQPFTETFDILGKPSTKYPLIYKLTRLHLKIYKVVPAAEMSHNEIPYSEKDGGNYHVPIGGYDVSFFKVEKQRDSNNRPTNVTTKVDVDYRRFNEATHFKISGFKQFNRWEKRDVFPANYFTDGEWYFIKSLVSTKPGNESGIGMHLDTWSTGFDFANKVRFRKHKNYLRGMNAAIADQKKAFIKKEGEGEDDVITIPVLWADFAPKPEAKVNGTVYTGLDEIMDLSKPDVERQYGRFIFAATNSLEFSDWNERISGMVIRGVKLEDLTIAKDGFSYTLTKVGTGEKTRYSFRKVMPSDYKARPYLKTDSQIFGAFWTTVPYIVTSKDDRSADVEVNTLVNRFNPNKPIVFRFSKETPKFEDVQKDPSRTQIDYRAMGRACTKYWARAFELAGTNIKVELREDQDANLGDLNSNVINIIDTLNEYGMAGVGPSTADPNTGEIIAGAANVYIATYRKVVTGNIRNYVRVRSGLVKDFAFSKEVQKEHRLIDHTQREVEHYCPDVVKFADSLNGRPQINSENENKVIQPCIAKLLTRIMTEVTCHEMGHLFNLRHNFQGSSDKENGFKNLAHMQKVYPKDRFPEIYGANGFYPSEAFMPQSSSVMDYMPEERPFLIMPGLYDIAQIAFYYGGKVVKANTRDQDPNGVGQLVAYDTTKAFNDQPDKVKVAQKFGFCTDEEAGTNKKLSINPFCLRHDFGNTPIAMMNYWFESRIRDEIVLNFRRWDRYSAQDSQYPMYAMDRISGIYKLYRAYLYDFLGRDNAHLQNITDEESYETLKADLKARFKHKEFEGVSEKYVKIMTDVFSIPDLYCIGVRKSADRENLNGTKDLKLFHFQTLFSEIIAKNLSEKVEGCSDPVINKFLAADSNGEWEVVGDIGYPESSVRFSQAKNDTQVNMPFVNEGFDIAGLQMVRTEAMRYLNSSLGKDDVYELVKRNHTPNAMDEPYIREGLNARIEQHLFSGLDASAPVTQVLNEKGYKVASATPIKPFKKFRTEWRIYGEALNQMFLFRNTEDVSEVEKTAAQRIYTMAVSKKLSERRPREAYFYYENLKRYIFASPSETVAYKVVNKLRELDDMVRFDLLTVDSNSQEGYWQLAEAVRDLPVTLNQKNVRFDYNTVMAFAARLREMRNSPYLDATLKGSVLEPFFEKVEKFNQHVESLTIASQAEGQMVDGTQMTSAQAKSTLAKIRGREANFLAYFGEQTGLTRENLTQKAIAFTWVSARGNTNLLSHWQNHMEKTIDERVDFMNDDRREYEAQREAMFAIVVSKLNFVDRDPL